MFTLPASFKIAIDGYSSCGKSSFAKRIAGETACLYIDSGAMYRAVTLYCLENKIIKDGMIDTARIESMLSELDIDFRDAGEERHISLNGRDVEKEIRSLEVSAFVSPVSRISSIRERLVSLQRKLSKGRCVVMDGRDIGTVVFPDADIKIFMTADVHIRAERRYLEMQEKGIRGSLKEIENNILERDYMDENRQVSPLRKASDAWILDNSDMSIDEQMVWFRNLLKKKIR